MSQSLQDGLVIDNSVFIIDEKKPGFPISTRMFQFLAIIIGSWSVISIFLESLSVPVKLSHINMAVLITTGIMFALCLFPGYDVVKQFFGALFYVLFAYSRFPRLRNGFFVLENLVIDKTSDYYGYQSMRFKADYTSALEDTSLLMIMILIPVVSLLTVAIVRNKYVSLNSLLLFFPVSASFLIGVIPSERYLIAYVITVLYLSRSGYSTHHLINKEQKTLLHRIHSRSAVWLSLIGILVFFLVKLFVSPEEYEGVAEIKNFKTELQTSLFDFSIEDFTKKFTDFRLPGSNKATGGLNGGELGKTGQVNFTNSEQLLLTTPITSIMDGIYLKGYVGSVYTGDKWESHSKEDTKKYKELLKMISVTEFPPVNQVSLLLNNILGKEGSGTDSIVVIKENLSLQDSKYKQGKMKIEYQAANKKYLYAPYFTDYELLEEIEYRQDLYSAPRVKNDSYELDYYYNISLFNLPFYLDLSAELDDYSKNEKFYRNYVYQVYTKLPEEGLERLKQDFSVDNVQTATNRTPERIEYVMNYLSRNTDYSLSPGKLPKGKDFVEYFLYENKLGYCSHYASAATLMLRAMGIPARYVEGYAVSMSDVVKQKINVTDEPNVLSDNTDVISEENIVEIAVKDYNAHAWVEVYFDNCGWIPLEFTPGSAVEYNNSMVDEMSMIGEIIKQDEEEQLIPTEAPTEPIPTEELQEEEQPEEENENAATAADNDTKKQAIQIDALFFAFVVLFLVAGGITISIMKIRYRRRVRLTRNHNRKALFLFVEIEKILSSCKGLPRKGTCLEDGEAYVREHCSYVDPKDFTRCMETVRKARFGKGSITSKELQEVELFHQSLYEEVYKELSLGKKVYLKFILSV